VLLPHFGPHASGERVLQGARDSERYGFDSVWVRDHLMLQSTPLEGANPRHLESFMTLSAVAAVTRRLVLGTATLIPHRHPIQAAVAVGCLDFLAGPGRVIVGWGIGGHVEEFESVGMGDWDRREVAEEQVRIFRKLWTGKPTSHAGKYYTFSDVTISPVPTRPVPIWYGGMSRAAVRRAVEYCDGWIPGQIPHADFDRLMSHMRRLAETARKPVPTAGVIPCISPAQTVEEGLRAFNIEALLAQATAIYGRDFQSRDDLAGVVIGGPRDVIIESVRRFQASGVDHFVFDLRARFAEFAECLQLLGEEVLPVLHREDGRAREERTSTLPIDRDPGACA
jgi:alkanesulfonate monooxygenase SsuD/methylene tetrahydromethanopterin reductase-like flavin-dependent oxidoreductase (luciferase family)